MSNVSTVSVSVLEETITRLLRAVGVPDADAAAVSRSLVRSDVVGVGSHGAMLVPMYVARLKGGSISARNESVVVSDSEAVAVIDAHNALGQLTAAAGMMRAVEKAARFGIGAVSVRRAFHFGRASEWADLAAERGFIGVAMANTRAMMPAPGGAVPVIGNNPIAVAVPGDPDRSFTLDMALSEVAMGKIRLAAAQGEPIPETWATDIDGVPTTDARAAIDGMLLPVGGAKGFGLALVVEALTGVLAGGAVATEVRGLYQDPALPNDSSQFFLAIDPQRFAGAAAVAEGLARLSVPITGGAARDAANPPRLPGHRTRQRAAAAGDNVTIAASVRAQLLETAARLDVDVDLVDVEVTR